MISTHAGVGCVLTKGFDIRAQGETMVKVVPKEGKWGFHIFEIRSILMIPCIVAANRRA